MLVVGGESLIDLVARADASMKSMVFDAHAGGSPYNCAIALARLGQSSGFMCPISEDSFGDMLLAPLMEARVHPLMVKRVKAPSSLAVVTLDRRGQARYEFYRRADRAFNARELLNSLPPHPTLFQIGGFCAIEPEDAASWLEVAQAALGRGAVISIDPNIRPSLVSDMNRYRMRLDRFFDLAHIIKLSNEDLRALDPQMSISAHAAALLERPNCELVVVSLGEEGSRAFTTKGLAEGPVYKPKTFGDTVGAGDSLMAGILAYLADHRALRAGAIAQMSETELGRMLKFASVVAGLNCAHTGCHPPMRREVEAALNHRAS